MKIKELPVPILFEWDEGNNEKNWKKHKVSEKECVEIFKNYPVILNDTTHSQHETRFIAIGKSKSRYLFIVFTIRKRHIRVISARDQSRKEREFYKQKRGL